MKEIIFIADDFGLNSSINDAILHAHQSGNLHGAALMIGQNAMEQAVAMAHQFPTLQIGWHLHLNDSLPTTIEQWPWGASPVRAGWSLSISSANRRLVREEMARQWELFQTTGLKCAFINSHHHLHAHPFVYRTLLEIVSGQFNGWIRLGRPRAFQSAWGPSLAFGLGELFFQQRRKRSAWRSPDTLWGIDRTFRMDAVEVRSAIDRLSDGFHEFLFHPRSVDCPDTQTLIALKKIP